MASSSERWAVLGCGWTWWPYVKRVLTKGIVRWKEHETHEHQVYVKAEDIPTVMALFPFRGGGFDDEEPRLESHPFVKFVGGPSVEGEFEAGTAEDHTGIVFEININLRPVVLGYLRQLAVSVSTTIFKVPDEARQIFIVVDADPRCRFALAKDLLCHFDEEISATLKDRWGDGHLRLYGNSICAVLLEKASSKDLAFHVHKVRPKRNVNVKLPWRKMFTHCLEKVNKSTNEDALFDKVSTFLENLEYEYLPGRACTKVETLRQKHARLMYRMLDQILLKLPRARKEYGAPPSQILAECVVDRPNQRDYSNLDSKNMTFTHGSYTRTRKTFALNALAQALKELIVLKKELDWWKSCNCRLFVNKSGRFFRDDKRLKLWKATYKKRHF
jgi:hypothetical protein